MVKNPIIKNLTKQEKQQLLNKIERLGDLGELWFELYLTHNLKHRIIACNFSYRIGEIDIISCYKNRLYFWEVKSRSSINYGYPEEAVRTKKIRKLEKGIEIFLNRNPQYQGRDFCLRVVSLIINKGQVKELSWFEV